MNLRHVLLSSALGAAVATGAVAPAAAQVYGGIYVQTAPPAPIYETVPAAPGPNYYWVGGYWTWNGYRYVWTHGHYATVPYAGAVWHPGHWAHNRSGYYWRPGHWGRPY
jgi:WXXGXW repeat (2 copies)